MRMRRAFGVAIAVACLATCLASTGAAADLPRKAPPLTIGLPEGGKLALDSYKGKAVLLAFILTTCPHCQFTTGLLKQFQTEYGPRGLQVVEAAIDQGAEMLVPGFIQRFTPNFPAGFVAYDTSAQFIQHNPMMIMHVPALVFIDRQGTIRAEFEGDDPIFSEETQEKNLREQVEKLLHAGDLTRKTPSKAPAKN